MGNYSCGRGLLTGTVCLLGATRFNAVDRYQNGFSASTPRLSKGRIRHGHIPGYRAIVRRPRRVAIQLLHRAALLESVNLFMW